MKRRVFAGERQINPAVVLSSNIIGLAVIRALGVMGVPVTSIYYRDTDVGYVSKYVRRRVRAPHPERHEQEFLNVVIEQADPFSKAVLIPADDATLTTVSKHKRWLESSFLVACTNGSVAERLIDKKHTYALAEEIGIPAPKTLVPGCVEEAVRFARALGFPCLVKPRRSHQYYEVFQRKLAQVNSVEELIRELHEARAQGLDVMIQELIPGNDTSGVNYNSFRWNNEPLVEFTAKKVRLSPPGFGVPTVLVSQAIPEIIEPGRRILSALGYDGFSCVEFKRDARNGTYKLMEVNGRHNLSGLLALCCGINFPWIEYRHLLGHGLELPPRPREGVYWIHEFKDVGHSLQFARRERYRLWDFVRPYLRPHIFAIFSLTDPLPFLKRWIDVGKWIFGKVARVHDARKPVAA